MTLIAFINSPFNIITINYSMLKNALSPSLIVRIVRDLLQSDGDNWHIQTRCSEFDQPLTTTYSPEPDHLDLIFSLKLHIK